MAQFVYDCLNKYYFWGYAGGIFGAFLAIRNLVRGGVHPARAGFVIIAGFYGALLGSRVLFLIDSNPRSILSNPGSCLVFWEGGLSWLGAPVFGALMSGIVILTLRLRFWQTLGGVTIAFPVVHAIGRIGCLVRGCCYGRPSTLPWAIYSGAVGCCVHPTQVYCMLCEACLAVLLQFLHRRRDSRKYLFPLYLLLSALHRFVTEAFRGAAPGVEIIGGLRFYQSLCVLLFATAAAILLLLRDRRRYIPHAMCIVVLTVSLFFLFLPREQSAPVRSHERGGTYLVFTRPVFRSTLGEWVRLRERQGFRVNVTVIENEPDVAQVETLMKGLCTESTSYLLIVGDCAAVGETDMPWHFPSPATANGDVSDALYTDTDKDGFPDFPVGRLPVRSETDLEEYVKKLVEYEEHSISETRRVVTWLDVPGYEETVDREISVFPDIAPTWADNILVSRDDTSQEAAFLQAISLPVVFSIVISHGSRISVGPHYEFSVPDLEGLYAHQANGPMFLLSCFSGEFKGRESEGYCLAEALVMHRAGPIATVASSGSVGPLLNYVMARTLANLLKDYDDGRETIGDLYLDVARLTDEVMSKEGASADLGGYLPVDLLGQTGLDFPLSRILSYNLLGDPAAPVHLPPRSTVSGANPISREGCCQ